MPSDLPGTAAELGRCGKVPIPAVNEKNGRDLSTTSSMLLTLNDDVNGQDGQPHPDSQPIWVWWDVPQDQDPENPMNWPTSRKWINVITISIISFLV